MFDKGSNILESRIVILFKDLFYFSIKIYIKYLHSEWVKEGEYDEWEG